MKRNTVLIIGIMATIMVFGAAVALAQNSSENKKDPENLECTPEIMKDMPQNCPEQMMQSGACENMMKGAKDCNEMMGNKKPTEENNNTVGESHCGGMESGMGSMMGSGRTDTKGMM
ncbi:MAG: hypothetical protein FIB07_11590 [Candidatus Methanoperedens sp.]|nr:hypothetical protein [Candidatus Methanoperedens sp.]